MPCPFPNTTIPFPPVSLRPSSIPFLRAALLGAALIVNGLPAAPSAPFAEPETTGSLRDTSALNDIANEKAIELSRLVIVEKEDRPTANVTLPHIAGGSNVIDAQSYSLRRVGNIADVLAFQPGVFAASVFGGESIRLSIRGSGIQRSPTAWAQGVQTFFDGLSVTDSNGTPYESFEPLAVERLEVLRGGNAFIYSPLALGGAINYVTRTGYTAPRLETRFEAGSFGYLRGQLSTGGVTGDFDHYVSLTGFSMDGFRRISEAQSVRFVGNFGYRFGKSIETRLLLRFANQRQQTSAGALSWSEILSDRRQSSPATPYVATRINPNTYSIGSITTWQVDSDSKLTVRLQVKNQPINNTGAAPELNIGGGSQYRNKALVGSVHYDRTDIVLGRVSRSSAAVYFTDTFGSSGVTQRANGSLQSRVKYGGSDLSLLLTNDTDISSALTVNLVIAAVNQQRVSTIVFPTPAFNGDYGPTYFGYAPRFGLIYKLSPHLHFFGSASRSVEAPININYARATAAPITNYALRQQKANTYEIGTRGQAGPFDWNVSAYYSAVRDELLNSSVQLEPPPILPVIVTANSSPTAHRGIETGLGATLWRGDGASRTGASRQGERLTLRATYTFSDFYLRNDPLYESNRLPAVPRHQLQAELLYEAANGFFAAVNTRAVIDRYPVDFANTLWAKPYTVYGARLGYAAPDGRWSVFLDADNLTDKTYAASVVVLANSRGLDTRNFYPGLGVNFTSGVTFRF